ncbi:hypothetical protein C8R46DRAFT_485700 [Mycena filopes]|nr:hypothetical protein C8R46DRAFT_485700 [Mycena filopes]
MKNTQSPPTRKCSCACDPACNCNCSCARHCDCKKPCEKRCGSELSRNLIVSLDGTLNEFGLYNTNVVELHSRIDPDNSNQRKYYNSGLGTYVPHRTLSLWKRFRQLFTSLREFTIAWNFHVKILKAYKWLCETYKPGDKIFLFGFSRGAYQVRALAAMIHKVGLIHHAEDDMIQFAYDVYEERNTPSLPKRIFRKIMTVVTGRATNERVYTAKDCKGAFSREVETHFIGVWDTVSSIGLFGQKPLPDTWKAEHICIFRHALALDERRVKFLPEYVAGDHSIPPLGSEGASNLLSRGATLAAPESSSEANVGEGTIVDAKEVWFAGCHSDIGGGSRINLELDLASIPLLWMEKEAASAGLRMKQRKTGDVWNMRDLGKDTVTDALNGLLGPFYHFVEILPISRLSYDSEVSGKRTCVPHCRAGRIIVSGQLIHASVAFQQKPYIPRATFSKPPLEWPSLVGHDLGNDDFRWVPRFADVLEMDLFDGPSIYHAISEFQAASPPTDVDYWILRLKFMALSGRLAVTYLGQLADGEDRLEKARDARMLLEGIKDSNGESDPAFHAEVVTLLEYEARELLGRKKPPGGGTETLQPRGRHPPRHIGASESSAFAGEGRLGEGEGSLGDMSRERIRLFVILRARF